MKPGMVVLLLLVVAWGAAAWGWFLVELARDLIQPPPPLPYR